MPEKIYISVLQFKIQKFVYLGEIYLMIYLHQELLDYILHDQRVLEEKVFSHYSHPDLLQAREAISFFEDHLENYMINIYTGGITY